MAEYYFDALQELDLEESCVLIGDGKQVRGNHLNIVTTGFRLLACALTGFLREVARQP